MSHNNNVQALSCLCNIEVKIMWKSFTGTILCSLSLSLSVPRKRIRGTRDFVLAWGDQNSWSLIWMKFGILCRFWLPWQQWNCKERSFSGSLSERRENLEGRERKYVPLIRVTWEFYCPSNTFLSFHSVFIIFYLSQLHISLFVIIFHHILLKWKRKTLIESIR